MEYAFFDCFINFAVGLRHGCAHFGQGIRAGIGGVAIDSGVVFFAQGLDGRFVGFVAQAIALVNLDAFDCGFAVSQRNIPRLF